MLHLTIKMKVANSTNVAKVINVANCSERSQTFANDRKRSQMIANSRKRSQIVANSHKWSQTIANGCKQLQTVTNGRKLLQMVENGRKWSYMSQMLLKISQNCITVTCHICSSLSCIHISHTDELSANAFSECLLKVKRMHGDY